MKTFDSFTGLYSLSKTLRFELQPQGKTLEHIQGGALLEGDLHRADSYLKVKVLIDEYHKYFIDDILGSLKLPYSNEGQKNSLEEFYTLYMCAAGDKAKNDRMRAIQDNMRKIISKSFSGDKRYKRLNGKELIRTDLLSFVKDEENRKLVKEFKDFTTYFTGFHKNRLNMYVADANSISIAYRLIHENLPRFIDNMNVFESVAASSVADKFPQLYKEFEEYLNVNKIDEIFKLDYYNTVLTQAQIDVYNAVIGGKTLDNGRKIQGLNEYINLYNQAVKEKSARLPKFKPLYKQILSDRNAVSWLPDEFSSDDELLVTVEKAYRELHTNVFVKLRALLVNISDYDVSKIYLKNDSLLTNISQRIYGKYDSIRDALLNALKKEVSRKSKKETDEAYKERLVKILKSLSSVSIGAIEEAFAGNEECKNTVSGYFAAIGKDDANKVDLFTKIENAYAEVKDTLNIQYPEGKNLAQDKPTVEKLKNLLDAIKELQQFVKPLLGDGNEPEKDARFYGEFSALWDELAQITPLYNMVRNRVTRKPYSIEKIKLNFENPILLDGWPVEREIATSSILLRSGGYYYLGLMNKKFKKEFKKYPAPLNAEDVIEKMFYLQAADPSKDVQNLMVINGATVKKNGRKEKDGEFAGENIALERLKLTHLPKEINRIRLSKSYSVSSDNFSKVDLIKFIDYYKERAKEYYSSFVFEFLPSEEYSSFGSFTNHINEQAYQIQFKCISKQYIENLVEEGKLYLFKIYNKDFSPYAKGKPNLHTLYWRMLFDERNLSNVVYKLCGGAEIFFRKASITCSEPTHRANLPVANKNPLNDKRESLFAYDLIKDRRYTVDKFQFHVPIIINFKGAGKENINDAVNEYIRQADNLHIIGIDRGERHLLYVTVIDLKGNIKEQHSLNVIGNTDYHNLLECREKERDEARRSWQTVEKIKDVKEGYLSQAIHEITRLMIKYNAIVVLEDLNMGFMRERQKVEKQVYQKFEKMLIDKLNYIVLKDAQPNEAGGLLNAYQLANKFDTFSNKGKQCGFLFYTQAWNTSKIDPVTGFVNLFDTRYVSMSAAVDFFKKFDSIKYNSEKDWFEFAFDYNCFTAKAEGSRSYWTICTYGNRIETKRERDNNNQFVSCTKNITNELKELFAQNGVNINCDDIKDAVLKQKSSTFFESLLHLLRLTLQMRNSATGTDVDYMISPVMGEDGTFFDSNSCSDELPKNADANGAYNIARKGLWIVRRIKSTADGQKPNLAISNKEWLNFAQTKPYKNN